MNWRFPSLEKKQEQKVEQSQKATVISEDVTYYIELNWSKEGRKVDSLLHLLTTP